jgi:hypothetical protein
MAFNLADRNEAGNYCRPVDAQSLWDGLMVRIPVAILPNVSRVLTLVVIGLVAFLAGEYSGRMTDLEKLRYVETRIQKMTGEQSERSTRESGVDIGNRNSGNNVEQSRRDI